VISQALATTDPDGSSPKRARGATESRHASFCRQAAFGQPTQTRLCETYECVRRRPYRELAAV